MNIRTYMRNEIATDVRGMKASAASLSASDDFPTLAIAAGSMNTVRDIHDQSPLQCLEGRLQLLYRRSESFPSWLAAAG